MSGRKNTLARNSPPRLRVSCEQLRIIAQPDITALYAVPLCNGRNIYGGMKGERGCFDRIAPDVFALFKYDLYTGLRVGLVDIFGKCHVRLIRGRGYRPRI